MAQLKDPAVLSDLISEVVGRPKQNSKSFILTCPRCSKKDKLYIRKKDGRFVCWVCAERDGFQGAPEFALTELTGKTIAELRSILYGMETTHGDLHLQIELTDFLDSDDEILLPYQQPVDPHPDFRDLDSQYGAPGAAYLESRGVPIHIAKEYGVVYWPARSRVVFPVVSNGVLLGWQSRTIKPTEEFDEETQQIIKIPKALTYEGLDKAKVLMFADRLKNSPHAVLAEGPIDGIKAHLVGGNVVSMGKVVSQAQLNLLRCSGIRKLYLALDPDASVEAEKIVRKMYGDDIEIYDMRPKPGLDLGAMTFEEVYELYRSAPRVTPANLFLFLESQWN